MNLYIRIKDGQPFEHPIFEDNFRQAFPDVDTNNLPPEFARFERVERPVLGEYEVMVSETSTYELIDGVWKDVWHKREMTAEEKEVVNQANRQAVIKVVQDIWAARPQAENWSAWVFNEEVIKYVPPVPRPATDQTKVDAGVFTYWCGADANWKDTPAKPVDENQYKFDFFAWQWVQVVN
jgi:hypothetical protein